MSRRDRIVVALANGILRFATPRYRALLRGLIVKGIKQAIREQQGEGR